VPIPHIAANRADPESVIAARCRLRSLALAAALVLHLLMAACAAIGDRGAQRPAVHPALRAGAEGWVEAPGTELPLRWWRSPQVELSRQPGDTLRIYLGGDGRPWADEEPAAKPDAQDPLALWLFSADPEADVYLGRPCYHFKAMPSGCTPNWWTSHRYAPEVVDALLAAIEHLLKEYPGQPVELVGYSGGGTLAVLLSARSTRILRVLTVAPNLDVAAWTRWHGVLPLSGSLDPATAAAPQARQLVHVFGARDAVVPPALARPYLQQHPRHQVHVVEGFDHHCCWRAYWPRLLSRVLPPARASGQ